MRHIRLPKILSFRNIAVFFFVANLGMRTESWTLGRPDWSPHVFDGGSAQGR